MGRFGEDIDLHRVRVERAMRKVDDQLQFVASLAPDDPRLRASTFLLDQMRQSASSAAMSCVLAVYGEEAGGAQGTVERG